MKKTLKMISFFNIKRYKLQFFNTLMKEHNIPSELQRKGRKHLEYVWRNEDKLKFNMTYFLNSFSLSVKEDLLIDIYYKILNKNLFLSKNFSSSILKKLSTKITEIVCTHEECVIMVNLFLNLIIS